ncbi:hypothetical protein [Alistipes putredinis]|jgi:hypothetical protein|uniref:hypothetical protein n=1 Tax=Alistipes putredinis TaxID=28117 RepID=UPI003AAEB23D
MKTFHVTDGAYRSLARLFIDGVAWYDGSIAAVVELEDGDVNIFMSLSAFISFESHVCPDTTNYLIKRVVVRRFEFAAYSKDDCPYELETDFEIEKLVEAFDGMWI